MKLQKMIVAAVFLLCCVGSTVWAQNYYYWLPLRQLRIDGQWPDAQQASELLNWREKQYLKYYVPYAVGDQGEEIYIDIRQTLPQDRWNRFNLWHIESVTQLLDGSYVAIKTKRDTPPAGTVYLPKPDLSGMIAVKFTVPADTAPGGSPERQFYTAMQNHYDFLRNAGFTGAAWFRYRAEQARNMLEKDKLFDPNELQPEAQPPRPDNFDESMSLFTGARAVSENIQLDRALQTRLNEPRTIDIKTLTGITTAQIDWKGLVSGDVEKDPLSSYIPADQHAIFYPTFKSMMNVMDEVKSGKELAMPIHLIVEHIEQYEQQICVWLDGWSRFWGPKTIRGVALTGSDPYMQSGTDAAILFDARMTGMVYGNTESKQAEKLETVKGAKKFTGTIDGVDYQAVMSPDRAVSSYLAAVDDVVVVTNSLAQLKKIIQTAKKQQKSIADLDEYAYFRSRYPLDKDEQSAFLVMSDAAIRRWCSPTWRIGAARRAMAAAVLSQLQAEYIDKRDNFDLVPARKEAKSWAPDIGDITLTEAGVTSSTYGNLAFMTPIIELSIDKVSEQEKEQYRRFRQNYQRQWQMFFDPIAVSLLLEDEKIDVDMTVRPLVAATAYRPYIQIAGNNAIQPGDGDVHPQTLLQIILAIDTESDLLRQMGGFAMQMMNQDINALGWMGRWVTLYADQDPFWSELAEHMNVEPDDFSEYMEDHFNRLPVALAMDVDNNAKLTLFLVSLRAFIQQTAPDMTTWESLTHNEKAYVKVNLRHRPDVEKTLAVYYAILPDSLIVSLHEDLIKRAIDRGGKKDQNAEKGYQWLGQHIAARADEKAWPVIEMLADENYSRYLQMQTWNNLPILNEWHAQQTALSPAEFHKKFWHTELTCPAGGRYSWNEQYQTMTSTVFGYPGAPEMPDKITTPLSDIKDVQLGMTFEGDGLRAKTIIERQD